MYAKMISILRWTALIAMIGVWLPCQAQFSANLQGTVSDPHAAALSNATVALRNTATGVESKQTTNASGFYRFTSLAPGDYVIKVSVSGFKDSSTAVRLNTSETHGVDVSLTLADATSFVYVTASAPFLNPDETRLQQTLNASEISRLPLPNRDVQQLIALTPGVVGVQNESPTGGYGSSIFAGTFSPAYSANGLANNSNLYIIDDLPVSDVRIQGGALILPNQDMIDQVSLQTQTYSVENGTAASIQTSFTTKSGGNDYHGSADYSYDSSNVGAAKQPVVNSLVPFHQNLWLGSLGGKILTDRTFFFGSIERQDAVIGGASETNPVFTPEFARWALAAFPNSGAAQGLVFAPPTRDSGGIVKTAGEYYGAGSSTPCGQTNTLADGVTTYNLPCDTPVYRISDPSKTGPKVIFNQGQPFNGIQWNTRLDQNFRGGRDRIYGMYERIDQKLGNLAERPKLDGITPSQNKYLSVNYTHVFNARLLNELHFGNLRVINGSKLGDPRATSIPYLPILLDTAAGFQFTFPFGSTPFAGQTDKQHTYAVRDTVSYTVGNHNLRVGYQFFRGDIFEDSSQIYTRPFVPFYFTDTFSWVSNTATAGYNLYTIGGNGKYTPQYYGATSIYNGIFVDDSWKLRPNLTVTVGLRYDAFGNPTKYGSTAGPFAPLFPGSGSNFQEQAWDTHTRIAKTAFTEAQNMNFMPRVGFAYSPSKSKLTLLRGGVGLYENVLTPFQIAGNLPTQPPNRISLFSSGVVPYGDFKTTGAPYGYNYSFAAFGTDPFGNIYSGPPDPETGIQPVYSANLNGFVPTIKPEKIINYSLGLEQQFPSNLVFSLSYVGSHAYDLVYGASASGTGSNSDYNVKVGSRLRPTSEWGSINYGRNGLVSNYNELVATLKQNYKGLSYQANYNWSRSLQDAPTVRSQSTTYSIWKGIYDPKSYYGPSSYDVPNSFSLAGGYEVPKIFHNGLANEASAGWRLTGIVIAQSGTPFTVIHPGQDFQNDGSANFNGNNGAVGYPNFNGSKRRGFERSKALTGVFTANQFSDPDGLGTRPVTSNQGANTFRNFGYFTINTGLAKTFGLPFPGSSDGAKLVLRGEAVNLLNRTNYQAIQNDITNNATFGTVQSANQKRYLQVGARFEF